MNKSRLFGLVLVGAAFGLVVSGSADAARRGMPSDGAAFPADRITSCAYFVNGAVLNVSTAGGPCSPALNWDLPAIVDNTTTVSKTMTVYSNGNGAMGTVCWGVSLAANGSATLGASKTGQLAGHTQPATSMTTHAVSVSSSATFLVTCQIPYWLVSNTGRITQFSYSPT